MEGRQEPSTTGSSIPGGAVYLCLTSLLVGTIAGALDTFVPHFLAPWFSVTVVALSLVNVVFAPALLLAWKLKSATPAPKLRRIAGLLLGGWMAQMSVLVWATIAPL